MSNQPEQQVADKMKAILSKFARNRDALASMQPDTKLRDELGISSVNLIDILLEVEESFSVAINDAEMFELVTLQDCIVLINSKRPAEAQPATTA